MSPNPRKGSSPGMNPDQGKTAAQLAERAKLLRMMAYFIAGVCSLVAIGFLMSLGRDTASGEVIDAQRILTALLKATLSMALAFWVLQRLLRHEDEHTARGRKVSRGGLPPGTLSAVAVAAQCLLLTLGLMAIFELGAQTLGSEESADQASSGAMALERARSEARAAEELNDEGDPNDPSGQEGRGARRSGGLLSPDGVSATPNAAGAGSAIGDLLSDEATLRVRTTGPPAVSSVHLRGFVLDRYGSDGILRERSTLPRPIAASQDGWIRVETATGSRTAHPSDESPLELGIEFIRPSNGIVFAPAHLLAVQTPALSFDPGLELWRIPESEVQDYRVRSNVPAWALKFLNTKRSRGSVDQDWLTALPPATRMSKRYHALKRLGRFAEELTQGCSSDLESVLAIVSHLRSEFGYDLYDTSFLSPERCVELIDHGSGSCSHFASLAAILLRARAIPVRIAVGYVAQEPLPDEEGEGWLVRSRDGHAWIEVHFDGLGWLPFDATPGDLTAGGAVTGWAPVSDSERVLAAWTGQPVDVDPARTTALGEWVAEAVIQGAQGGLQFLARLTRGCLSSAWALWVILGAAAIGVLLYVRRLKIRAASAPRADLPSRERSRGTPAVPTGPSMPPLPEAQALMGALEARNLAQGKAQTPSQFARGVEGRYPESRGLVRAFLALLGRASTRRPLSATETKEVLELAERLRNGD